MTGPTHLLTMACVLRNPVVTGTDDYGDDVYADEPDSHATTCWVHPLSSEELAQRGDGDVRWRGYWAGADLEHLRSSTAVDVAGLQLQAVGQPRPFTRPGDDGPALVELDLADRLGS